MSSCFLSPDYRLVITHTHKGRNPVKKNERQDSRDAKVGNTKKYKNCCSFFLFFPTLAFLETWRSILLIEMGVMTR